MKVKIKGLVFVGFAAAVFAQSAMATPSEPARRVASKEYVDTYAQEQAKRVTTENISSIATGLTVSDPWQHDDMYPSMKVLKGVKDELGVASTINGDAQHYTQKIAVFEGGYIPTGSAESPSTADLAHVVSWKIVVPDSVVADDGAGVDSEMIAANDSHLTTVSAVRQYAETLTNKAEAITTTTGGNYDSTDEYASTKAVYDYAQPRVSTAGAVQVGYLGTGSGAVSEWQTLAASQSGTASATNYVTMTTSGGTNTINLASDTIATSSGAITTGGTLAVNDSYNSGTAAAENVAAEQNKLVTSKAVYDFVKAENAAYQPRVNKDGVAVGVRTSDGNSGYTYDWETIQANGGVTSTTAGTNYLTMTHDTTSHVYNLNLAEAQIAAKSDIVAATDSNGAGAANGVKLTTAQAVKDYLADFAIVAGNLPTECSTANSNGVCTLIAYYNDDTSNGQTAGIKYKWELTVPDPVATTVP